MLPSSPGEAVGFCCSVAAVLAAVACGSVAAPATPSSVARVAASQTLGPRRIVVLGDSLAVSPSKSSAFPALLQERLDGANPGWTVSNEGVGGDTTADGLRRLDDVLSADTRILVLELGANDGLRGVSIATIEANLAAIIERARARGIALLLCGMETRRCTGGSTPLSITGCSRAWPLAISCRWCRSCSTASRSILS